MDGQNFLSCYSTPIVSKSYPVRVITELHAVVMTTKIEKRGVTKYMVDGRVRFSPYCDHD